MTRRRPTHVRQKIELGPGLLTELDEAAMAHDMDTAAFVRCVLLGAMQSGQIDRLATIGATNTRVRRRARDDVREWVKGDPATLPDDAYDRSYPWHSDAWTLTRYGNARDGYWLLTGPGIVKGVPLDRSRHVAIREADALIKTVSTLRSTALPGDTGHPS